MQGHAVMNDMRRCNNKIHQIMADRERRVRIKHQTVMDTPPSTPPSIPSNNVRRCLFPDTVNEITRQEFRQKVFEEIQKATEKDGKEKYNFDLVNEVALEGDYEWYRKVNGRWVYMEPKPVKDLDSTKTPLRETDNKSLPEIGKRKRDEKEINHQVVKKRLHYD
ncbi:unnamed protein product [Spodoptera exigua]|nr:unnamed protein product [Spodoptera exigua]